ncbi:MAG: hypothetical protein ABSB61_10495 [Anaerolineales bacterium]
MNARQGEHGLRDRRLASLLSDRSAQILLEHRPITPMALLARGRMFAGDISQGLLDEGLHGAGFASLVTPA